MISALIRRVLDDYRSALTGRFGARVRRVCLYGSWARGEATESSDVDVAVVIDGLSPTEWQDAIRIAAEIESSVGLCFSPFVVSSERFEALKRGGGIASDIEREGITP